MKDKKMINLIYDAISVAMGVSVVVLNILDKIEIKNSLIMLGIGLLSTSISNMRNQ